MRRAPIRIELYMPLMGRGGELIAAALKNLNFNSLTTDGYAGYNKALEQHPGASHQICLVHWRRDLLDNAYDSSVVKDCLKLPVKKQEEYLLEQFEKKSPLYLILLVFRAISHIYGHERAIDELEPGSPEIEPIRAKQRALMDLISKIVNKLAANFAEKKGSGWHALNGNPIGASCAFYLNNEESLGAFLKKGNWLLEPDNNEMERSIRPVAVIRNASHFWTSPEYARSTQARLSVFRTLELNGIDPLAWSQKLCGAVYDYISAKLIDYNWEDTGELTAKVGIRAEAKPGEPDKLPEHLRRYRLSELTKDFPFKDWVAEALFGDKQAKLPQTPAPEDKTRN